MARKIKLTKGLFALVDDIDFKYLNQWKWYALYRAAMEHFGDFAKLNFATGRG